MTHSLRTFALGDLCSIVRGTSPTLKTPPGPYPLVVTAEFRRTSESWQFEGPAVCIPLISSTGHGHAALHRVHYQEGRFALATLLLALVPKDQSICCAKYLYHLLSAKKDELLVPLMQGTANVSLKDTDIAGVRVTLPPLEAQRRIVERIGSAARRITQTRQLREQIMADADALTVSIHLKLAGARTRKLGDILTLAEDKVDITAAGSYPQVGVKSFGVGLFKKAAISGTDTTYRTFNKLFDGALVLSQVKGWEGAVAVCPPELAGWHVSPEYRTFRCVTDEAIPNYLERLVRHPWFWGRLGQATRGVGARRERTRPEMFLALELPMPDVSLQEQARHVFKSLDDLRHLYAGVDADIKALLPSILDRAFKGEF